VGLYERWGCIKGGFCLFWGGNLRFRLLLFFSVWCVTHTHALIFFFFFFFFFFFSRPESKSKSKTYVFFFISSTTFIPTNPKPKHQTPSRSSIIQPTFSPTVSERVENTVDGCVRDAVGQSGRYYCRKEGAGVMRGIQLRFEEGCCGHGMC